jgi:hypothetical protein
MNADNQLPFEAVFFDLPAAFRISKRVSAPDASLTTVKLAASISRAPSAIRQRTEFAAKAVSANAVKPVVFINDISDLFVNTCLSLNTMLYIPLSTQRLDAINKNSHLLILDSTL